VTNVQGGPSWLERDRFDVIGKLPPKTSKDDMKLMLRALLAERFKLVLHTGTKPMPAGVLSVAKGGVKMKPATDDENPSCEFKGTPPPAGGAFDLAFSCKNTTMESFAGQVHDWTNGSYLDQPVVDSTGLKGGFDFNIRWTNRSDLAKAGADAITLFDATEKQLGLKLERLTAPQTVILVDSVSEKPSPNPPGLEKILPPAPLAEFEVATIKPSDPAAKPGFQIRIDADQAKMVNGSLRDYMIIAWDLSPGDKEVPVNAPKWLDSDHIDILAKFTHEEGVKPTPPDFDELRRMLRDLLIERFQIKTHTEERTMEGFRLVAAGPRLKKADPAEHTFCKEGPGPDGKDPRIAAPILNRLAWCQNMTMPQFADELQRLANGYVYGPVLDATGLDGAYDFALNFSSIQMVSPGADSAKPDSGVASEPNGALSLLDALPKQLGLKLEKQKRPMQVLVLDHIEEKPTEN
jgi:uncharacterized protein (TIGR03435 family)